MKKRILLFLILSMLINMSFVNADCTSEQKDKLVEEAKNITVKYKDIGGTPISDPDDPNDGCNLFEDCSKYDYGIYKITFEDISEEFNITITDTDLTSNSEEIILDNGDYVFNVYSNTCKEVIHTINVHLPSYNYLSQTSYCEGISKYDFYLCDPYDETDISYEEFIKKVTEYREKNNIKDDDEKIDFTIYINHIINFIKENIKYELIGVSSLVIIIIIYFLIKKRKKRGVL